MNYIAYKFQSENTTPNSTGEKLTASHGRYKREQTHMYLNYYSNKYIHDHGRLESPVAGAT
jgi:hypothetical protein